jgi:hypothetical protein
LQWTDMPIMFVISAKRLGFISELFALFNMYENLVLIDL